MKAKNMTLRDYFAAQALVGVLSNPNTTESYKTFENRALIEIEVSKAVYKMADAMMEQKYQ